MKKFLWTAILLVTAAVLFLGCSNNALKADENLISFNPGTGFTQSRSLTKTNPQTSFDASALYWKYEAKKNDETGLSTGVTSFKTAVSASDAPGISEAVGPFSVGAWTFTLYGYNSVDNYNANRHSYTGVVNYTVTNDSGQSVAVEVSPSISEGAVGYIQLPVAKSTELKDETGKAIESDSYEEVLTITDVDSNSDVELTADVLVTNPDSTRTVTLSSGLYAVKIAYVGITGTDFAGITYGEDTIYVTVYDYLTTNIGGDLEENTQEVNFDPQPGEATETVVVEDVSEGTSLEAQTSPQSPASESETTKVEIPAGAIGSTGSDSGDKVELTVKSYDIESMGDFVFTGTTEDNEDAIGAIDVTLTVNDQEVTDFGGEYVTVTTYILKGLKDVSVAYNGTGDAPEFVSYDSGTGELVFKTKHFSEFYVTSSSVAYVVNTKTAYDTLVEAVDAANSITGEEVIIWMLKDVAETNRITFKRKATLDLKGKTVSSSATTQYAFCVYPSTAAVTITGGGKLIASASTFAINNYGTLLIEEGTSVENTNKTGIYNNGGILTVRGNVTGGTNYESSSNTKSTPAIYNTKTGTVNIQDGAKVTASKFITVVNRGGTLNISGGEITNNGGNELGSYNVAVETSEMEGGTNSTYISGGTISGPYFGVSLDGTVAEISGGTITSDSTALSITCPTTVTGGTFTGGAVGVSVLNSANNVIFKESFGSPIVVNGTFSVSTNTQAEGAAVAVTVDGITVNGKTHLQDGTTTIESGTFNGQIYIHNSFNPTLIINGGNFTPSTGNALFIRAGNVTINGGTFETQTDYSELPYDYVYYSPSNIPNGAAFLQKGDIVIDSCGDAAITVSITKTDNGADIYHYTRPQIPSSYTAAEDTLTIAPEYTTVSVDDSATAKLTHYKEISTTSKHDFDWTLRAYFAGEERAASLTTEDAASLLTYWSENVSAVTAVGESMALDGASQEEI